MNSLRDISIQFVKGVGPARKKVFARLGIETVEDLLYFFPRRYEDRRHLIPLKDVKLGEWQTVTGKVSAFGARRSWYTRKHLTEITLDDGTGRLVCVWFNQPYLEQYFKADIRVVCYGKVDLYKDRFQMVSPEYEIIASDEDENLNLQRIVPIYSLTRGVTQRFLRKTVRACLDKFKDQVVDELPVILRNKHRLFNIRRSIENLHYPGSFENQEEALRRISFEEFYFFQIAVFLRRMSVKHKEGVAHQVNDFDALQYINAFPFELTGAQKRVIGELRTDLLKPVPMLRLLQGDVGSGKTVVAFFGCYVAALNGCQSAVMAPTEILARQHYETLCRMSDRDPFKKLRIAFLASSLKPAERKTVYQQIKDGAVDVVVGTHALLNEELEFKKLSYLVVDEQHKFGVRQRAILAERAGNPDVLIMTATPIPRTLCITLYGDLDLSVLDEMPAGRKPVKTRVFPPEQIDEVYAIVREKIKEGRQAYFVYPIIDESETNDLKAAESAFKEFSKKIFKNSRVGLVHGQMKSTETEEVMSTFKKGEIDILVSTTVLEVGIDVPNATAMVIEHAERFGLAQMHQLRGRIGRGEHESLCLLVADPVTEDSRERIDAILKTTDGFKIAQKDLEIRGPGHYFGRHQHGLNELKVANPMTQMDVLEIARVEAQLLLKEDPHFANPQHKNFLNIVRERYPGYLEMVKGG